jgi:aspartyl-tRNA(Asn)/glutamyl-tRNA(Gln) amidotransferase subunit C
VDAVLEEISVDMFNHLVHLAALELDQAEAEYLRSELNDQLESVRELEAIDVDPATPITSHGVPYLESIRAPLREDVVEPCKEADDIVDGAPESRDRFIVVPDIPAEALE